MSAASRKVFLSVSAQPDNLGDIAIRQACIEMVGGAEVVAYSGGMPAPYVDAFDFPPGTQVLTSRLAFVRSFLVGLIRRRAHLMLAPGPHVLPQGAGHLKSLATLVTVAAVRASGGSTVSVGQSIHGSGALGRAVQLAVARRCAVFAARDADASRVLGAPVDRCPDLALGETRDRHERDRVVLSFRGDRQLDDGWMAELVHRIRRDGFVPVFVTQVQRDDEQHRRWAELLAVEVVAWGERHHAAQMARVHQAMADAVSVVSDRLHAVIFGLQAGATPVVVLRTDPDKVITTLGDLLPLQVLDPGQAWASSPDWRATGRLRSELDQGLSDARHDLDDLGARVGAAFSRDRR